MLFLNNKFVVNIYEMVWYYILKKLLLISMKWCGIILCKSFLKVSF